MPRGCQVDATVGAHALVAFTQTGDTARRLARHRSPIPVLAFPPPRRCAANYPWPGGVETFLVSAVERTDDMVRLVDAAPHRHRAAPRRRPGRHRRRLTARHPRIDERAASAPHRRRRRRRGAGLPRL